MPNPNPRMAVLELYCIALLRKNSLEVLEQFQAELDKLQSAINSEIARLRKERT